MPDVADIPVTNPPPAAAPPQPAATPLGEYVPLVPKNPDSEEAVRTISKYNEFRMVGGKDSELDTQSKLHILSLAQGGQANLSEDETLNDSNTFYQQIYKPGKVPTVYQAALQNKDNFWGRLPGDVLNTLGGLVKDIALGGAETVRDSIQEINPLATAQQREDAGARKAISIYTGLKGGWDLISNRLWHGAADLIGEAGIEAALGQTTDPIEREKLERQESEIIRNNKVREKSLNDGIANARNDIAGVYRMIGASDRAKEIMSDAAMPSEAQQGFVNIVTDPTTLATEGLGKVVGTMVKAGVRTTGMVESAAILAEADTKLTSITTKRAALESTIKNTTDDAVRKSAQIDLGYLQPEEQKAQAAFAKATQDAKVAEDAVKSQMDDMAKPGIIRGLTSQGFGVLGKISDATAGTIEGSSALADRMVSRVLGAGADQETKEAVKKVARGFVDHALDIGGGIIGAGLAGTAGAALGGIIGAGPAGWVGYKIGSQIAKGVSEFLTNPELARNFARDFHTVGAQLSLAHETTPFWKGVKENTKGPTSFIASKLDNQLVYSIPDVARGTAAGATLGAVSGAVASGGDPQATVQGLASGGFFGMAGAGVGQIGKFRSAGELHAAAIGDRARLAGSLLPPDRALFNQLKPPEQLAFGVFGRAHPDLKITFTNEGPKGPNGQHYVTDTGGHININVASDNPLQEVLKHEVLHHIAMHDLGPSAMRYLVGDPLTGERGIFTKLDEHGNPIVDHDPVTGITSYVPDERFLKYQADYNARKLRDLPNEAPEGTYGIAQEMFAELHAAQITDPAQVQKIIRGFVPSDLVGPNVLKNWFGKLGIAYDGASGNPIGESADMANVRGLTNLITRYYKERAFRAHPMEHEDGMTKATPDIWRADKSVLENNLDGAGVLSRDHKTGEIQRDTAGLPILKSQKEVDKDMAKLTDNVVSILKANPHLQGTANDNGLRLVVDRPSKPGGKGREVFRGQVVPQEVLDALAATNDHNPIQIQNWMKMNGIMSRNDGSAVLATYNTASKSGKYATVEMKQRALVPLYTEVSPHTGQVNIQHYDPETMTANVTKMLKRKDGKELWAGQLGAALADINTYLTNLANGKPGETGIGLRKKGVINELFGINADANPYMSDVTKRSPSVFKTFRLDRLNRIREIAGERSPVRAESYELVRSFAQPRLGFEGVPEEPPVAAPVVAAPVEPFAHLPDEALPRLSDVAHVQHLPPGAHFLDPKGVRRRTPLPLGATVSQKKKDEVLSNG